MRSKRRRKCQYRIRQACEQNLAARAMLGGNGVAHLLQRRSTVFMMVSLRRRSLGKAKALLDPSPGPEKELAPAKLLV